MGTRKRIGLFFGYNENWIGGTYYWLNWVNALNTLPDAEKPVMVIISDKVSFCYLKNETNYPYLEHFLWRNNSSLWYKMLNVIPLRLTGHRKFYNRLKGNFAALLPCGIGWNNSERLSVGKRINWFPDFQYDHLPEFYTPQTYVDVRQRAVAAAYLSENLMLSSEDAARDFRRLFPNSKAKVYVQHFTVTHPDISTINKDEVLCKHDINRPYFYSPNQYWAHKNHPVVIDAVSELVRKGFKDILVLFSGKEWDDRNPDYVPLLKKHVAELGLSGNIRFLGFLDRKEQLVIMQNAQAVIQPSLFEGWSTVIEDARALNKYVIASDLDVNKEQLQTNVRFFERHSFSDLAKAIEQGQFDVTPIPYDQYRVAQARAFMKMIED